MVTFTCPACGQERTGARRRCYPCTSTKHTPESRELIRQTLTGVKHTDDRRRRNSEARKRQAAEGRTFDIAGHMRGRPHPNAVPVGTERVVKDGRVKVKCPDGQWRYRSRIVWAAANGPIPHRRVIHHINENPLDDRLENLQMLTIVEHMRLHATPERMRAQQARTVEARKRNGTYGGPS